MNLKKKRSRDEKRKDSKEKTTLFSNIITFIKFLFLVLEWMHREKYVLHLIYRGALVNDVSAMACDATAGLCCHLSKFHPPMRTLQSLCRHILQRKTCSLLRSLSTASDDWVELNDLNLILYFWHHYPGSFWAQKPLTH